LLSLIDRAINAFNAATERGTVSDVLPFAAVYGLLDALGNGSTQGVRVEDRSRFLRLFNSNRKEVEREVGIGNDVLIKRGLMEAKMLTAGGRGMQTITTGRMELTEKGRKWADRLNILSGSPIEARPALMDCDPCGTTHRSDVPCPW
jgi:hypothetical protein